MKKIATTIRCVPRLGYHYAQVRTVDVDVFDETDADELMAALTRWFAVRGIADAVFAIEPDDNGYFAIVNDEAFLHKWGSPLF